MQDKRVKYFRNKKNLGLVGNYNKALLDYATGDFVMFVPDDDMLLNNDYVTRATKCIKKYSLSWIAAGSVLVNIEEQTYKEAINKEFKLFSKGDFFSFHKWGYDNFCGLTILFNRNEALNNGAFNKELYNFDLELIFKLSISGSCAIMNSKEALYAITDNQSNHLLDAEFMFSGYKLYENLKKLTNEPKITLKLNKNIKMYITACFRYFLDRNVFDSLEFDDKYWNNYFKDLRAGLYYPFLDIETQERYRIFKEDKKIFKEYRDGIFTNTWKIVKDPKVMNFIKAFCSEKNS